MPEPIILFGLRVPLVDVKAKIVSLEADKNRGTHLVFYTRNYHQYRYKRGSFHMANSRHIR